VALRYVTAGDLLAVEEVVIDDSWITGAVTLPFTTGLVELDTVIGVGPVVAAHFGLIDGDRRLNVAAIIRVEQGRVSSVRAVTDRLSLEV
jgi:hypothetical protein